MRQGYAVNFYLLDALERDPAFVALERLAADDHGEAFALTWRHARLRGGDLADALADTLLYGQGTWADVAAQAWGTEIPDVSLALDADLKRLFAQLRPALLKTPALPWPAAADAATDSDRTALAAALRGFHARDAARILVSVATVRGAGPLARHPACYWNGQAWRPQAWPAQETLWGLDAHLQRLRDNVSAFVEGQPAHATLLYGPRGSGKSTAVRTVLAEFAARGLRLIDPGGDRQALPAALAALPAWPYPTLLFLDDLSFDHGEGGDRPLRSLLEGGLRQLPPRTLVVATSNRRQLVSTRFRERPDPLDDDVHAWDTHQERLALANRFGLVLTFPPFDRDHYMHVVAQIAAHEGVELPVEWTLEAQRFAERGHGYAGRTARQFVTELAQGQSASG